LIKNDKQYMILFIILLFLLFFVKSRMNLLWIMPQIHQSLLILEMHAIF